MHLNLCKFTHKRQIWTVILMLLIVMCVAIALHTFTEMTTSSINETFDSDLSIFIFIQVHTKTYAMHCHDKRHKSDINCPKHPVQLEPFKWKIFFIYRWTCCSYKSTEYFSDMYAKRLATLTTHFSFSDE